MTVEASKPMAIKPSVNWAACLMHSDGVHILGLLDRPDIIPAKSPTKVLSFKDFRNTFLAVLERDFPSLNAGGSTCFAISKSAFTRTFNTMMNNEILHMHYQADRAFTEHSDSNIKLDLNDIHCGEIHINCPELHAVPNCDCPIDFHCRGGILGAGCRAAEAVAKAAWFANVYPSCLVAKAAQEAANAAIKAQCEVARLAAMANCAAAKGALTLILTDKVSIGDIHTTVSLNPVVDATLSKFSFDEGMTKAILSLSVQADSPLVVNFGFTPEGPVGHLVCALKFDHPYSCNSTTALGLENQTVGIQFEKQGQDVLANFQTPAMDVTVHLSPTPIVLLSRDIPVMLDCPLVHLGVDLLHVTKGFNSAFLGDHFSNNIVEALTNGKYVYRLKEKAYNIPIHPVCLKIQEIPTVLVPGAKPSYLLFEKSQL